MNIPKSYIEVVSSRISRNEDCPSLRSGTESKNLRNGVDREPFPKTLGVPPCRSAVYFGAFPFFARLGHIAQAQKTLGQVLKDHPDCAKAHFVQAEIDAAEGHQDFARAELARAEQLMPGLPEEKLQAVHQLNAKLGMSAG